MKKYVLLIFCFVFALALFAPLSSSAQELNQKDNIVYISFFYGDGCPHCAKEELFLEKLEYDYPNVQIHRFEVWYNRDNAQLLAKVGKELGIAVSSVPLTIIGQDAISGYLSDAATGARILNIIKDNQKNGCIDIVANIQNNKPKGSITCEPEPVSQSIIVPFLGDMDPRKLSLPVLTVVIASIDGFNPCAMWVLVFLVSLLIGMQDRRKMWILGSAFIFASGAVYFLFLSAWLNFFLFIGFISWIRIAIGIVAIASGAYHLKEWKDNKEGACKVVDVGRKQKIMDRFRNIVSKQNFLFALGGIIAVAVSVNLVELVCSAGLPAIYTNMLAGARLGAIEYYLYLVLYIIIFMLDDMLIFVIAMATLRITGISAKYSRWSNLIGGVVIFALGMLLIFKPGWVMLG